MTKTFPTNVVLTATTGILLTHNIGELYDVLNFVLDDNLMTHQLPGASRAAEPHLVEQYPWLAELEPPRGDKDALFLWLADVEREHGAELDVRPAVDPDWNRGNALQDLTDIAAGRPIVGVVVPDGEDPA